MSDAGRPSALLPFGYSIGLHAALAALLLIGLSLPKPASAPQPMQIEAVVMDQAILAAAATQRAAVDRRERQQAERRRAEEQAAEQALAREQEALEARQQQEQEQLRQAEAHKAAEARKVADQQAKIRKEAEAKRSAEQQARARQEAERKRASDEARQRAEREADLRGRLADEEARTAAQSSGLKSQYVAAIQAHVERRWFKPPGMREGMRCTVNVTQIPGGEVVGVKFGNCNGGDAVRQSIETAIRNASPLPAPPNPVLFERQIELIFTPEGR